MSSLIRNGVLLRASRETACVAAVVGMLLVCGIQMHARAFAATSAEALAAEAPKVGDAAPELRLKDLDGRTHRLAEHSGKIVVLLWLNRRCPFCERILESRLPHTAMRLARQADEDVVFLAVNSTHDTTVEENRGLREQYDFRVPVLLDSDGAAARRYDARMTPQVFVIDKEGRIAYIGAFDDDPNGAKAEKNEQVTNYIVRTVESLAAGRPVRPAQTRPYGCRIRFEAGD